MNNICYDESIKQLISCGKFRISLGLERVEKILALFGNPQEHIKVIHVAGTNGKGSTCSILSNILIKSGYKVGLYTSPHLINYTERIKVDNKEISKEKFGEIALNVMKQANLNNIEPTEFEILTIMSILFFLEQKVDIAIIETGLGGRLDATNVFKKPLLNVITSIDFDHTDRLGDTIEKIAFEKAGIIKQNTPVITLYDNKGLNVIEKTAKENNSVLYKTDYSKYEVIKDGFKTPLGIFKTEIKGLWQIKNISLVFQSIEILRQYGFKIDLESISKGLSTAKWNARFQLIKEKSIIVDGAHNPSAAMLLRESLDFYFPDNRRIWIYSTLANKDYKKSLKFLFREGDIVICSYGSSLSNFVNENELKREILQNLKIELYTKKELNCALKLALELQNETDIIVVAGSLYSAGEMLGYIHQ